MATVEQQAPRDLQRRGAGRFRPPEDSRHQSRRRERRSRTVPDLDAAAVAELAETRARRAGRLGGVRLRGARAGAAADAEVADGQRRPRDRDDRLGDRQDLRGRAPGRDRLRRRRVRLLGEERREVPRGRAREQRGGRGEGQEADPAPPPARADRRDRAVELPADQLLRRLHPRARRREQRDPEALGGDAADLAAARGGAARERAARGRVADRHRPRRDGRGADRAGRHDHVHRLDEDRSQGRRNRRAALDPGLARARRQGPDGRAARRRPRARREHRRVGLDDERRADLHLDRARLRRGARLRRVRREGLREGARAAPGRERRSGQRRRRCRDVPAAARDASRTTSATPSRRARACSSAASAAEGAGGLLRADGARRRRPHDEDA